MMEMLRKSLRDSNLMRWSVLLSISFVMAVNYFFYDVLSPLQSLLRENLGFSNAEYGFLVGAYSIPNVFLLMAIIGGIILDKIGIRRTGFSFVAFMAIGSLLTAYGASDYFNNGGLGYGFLNSFLVKYSPALKLMVFGFFLFGLGAETSIVVITKIVIKWFKGKELAFALGLNLSVARVGTMFAFLFSNTLAQQSPWFKPIMLGAGLLVIGLLSFLIYTIFDIKIDKQIKETTIIAPEEKFRISDIGKIIRVPSFIYITLLCVTFYSAVFPFLKYAPDMLQNKFGFSGELSGLIVAILPFGTILFTPLFGLFTDYKGKSASVMILGSMLLVLVHLTFTFTNISPYIPMFVLGIAFSLVPAAMWPSLAKIIDNNRIGTAYGIMFSIQNIGLWIFPIIIGFVLDLSNPFHKIELSKNSFQKVVKSDLEYIGKYLSKPNRPIKNKELRVKTLIYMKDGNEKKTLYQETHDTKSDSNGLYNIQIGSGSEILYANHEIINISIDSVKVTVIKLHQGIEKILINDKSKFKETYKLEFANLTFNRKDSLCIILSLDNNEKTIIWKEKIVAKKLVHNKGEWVLGSGIVKEINVSYFDLQNDHLLMEFQVPLNYSYSVLLLSFLGVLGLIFAFLLRKDDKTSGFGLELPNRQKK